MKISIIVPAYNEEKVISQTLHALSQLDVEGEWEVILVDNASTDRTKEIAETFLKKMPLKIITENRKGRGRARATGFAHATGEILFSTDADTIPPADWVEKMLAPFSDPKVVASISAPIIHDAGPLTNWLYNLFGPIYFRVHKLLFGFNPLVGFSSAVRREAYIKSGGFNSELTAEEDVDLGLRIAKYGSIAFVSDARVVTSGRRWKRGAIAGVVPYIATTLARLMGKRPDLRDVR